MIGKKCILHAETDYRQDMGSRKRGLSSKHHEAWGRGMKMQLGVRNGEEQSGVAGNDDEERA